MSVSALLLCLIFVCTIGCNGDKSPGRAYYVNSEKGDDNNDGLSKRKAWKTLEAASRVTYAPGDKLLLAEGCTFNGKLELNGGGGDAENPVIVSGYNAKNGKTGLPVIDAKGYEAAIYLKNVTNISISDLELTADGGEPIEEDARLRRFGVRIVHDQPGTYENISLKNLYIHHIFAHESRGDGEAPGGKSNQGYGILSDNYGDAKMKNLTIENCRIEMTGRDGLRIRGRGDPEFIDGLSIINNNLKHIGGPGMVFSHLSNAVVRNNVIDYSGYNGDPRQHSRGSGIWTVYADNVLIEKNTCKHAFGKMDSYGIHIDIVCNNVVVQYNLSIDNMGGFVQILGTNRNCAYRYNISVNDGYRVKGVDGAVGHARLLRIDGYMGRKPTVGPFNTYVYNNTMYVKEDIISGFQLDDTAEGVLIANNIFYLLGGARTMPPNHTTFTAKNVVFTNNLFTHENLMPDIFPDDSNPFYGNPEFAHPGGFEPKDYIPGNIELIKNKGIKIEKLPGDPIGLKIGLEVETDFMGNPLVGLPDMGAIEINN